MSFWLFMAALPPFRIGIWVDSECVLVMTHVLLSILGLFLGIYCFFKKKFFYSNHTLIFHSLAVISAVATFWVKNPILHHFGSPLLGEGSVLFFGLSTLSLALDNTSKKTFIYWSAIIAGISAGLLVFLHHPQHGLNINPDWLPYVFGAFLAPISLSLYAISTTIKSPHQQKILIFLCCALLFLSHNKTAWTAFLLCLCIWPTIKQQRKIQKYLCLSIPFLTAISLFVLGNWPIFSTLESRKLALQSYILTWQDAPLSLFTGHGWGYYFENLQKQITNLPVAFFENHSWQPSWDGIDRLDFHSMHLGAEALFSLGIAGFLLYLLLLITPFFEKLPTKNNMHIFIYYILFGCLTSTWFTLLCVWPFLILGFSILNRHRFTIIKKYIPVLWLWLCAFISGDAAITYWQTAILYPANEKSLFYNFTYSKKLPPLGDLKSCYNYKGMHLGHFTLAILKKMNHTASSKASLQELYSVFKIYDEESSPLILDIALMHGMQYIEEDNADKQILWDNISHAIEKKAPKRSDLLVTYVQTLIEKGQSEKAQTFIKAMFNRNPKDPFAMWLEGIYCIHNSDIKQGRDLMRQALYQHIEKWIYIPKSLKTKIHGKTHSSIQKPSL